MSHGPVSHVPRIETQDFEVEPPNHLNFQIVKSGVPKLCQDFGINGFGPQTTANIYKPLHCRQLQTIANDYKRLQTNTNNYRRLQTIANDYKRFRTTTKDYKQLQTTLKEYK